MNILYSMSLNNEYAQELSETFRVLRETSQDDFIDILKKGVLRIGIVYMGDYLIGDGGVTNLLKEPENKNCNIAFCACTSDKLEIEKKIKDNYKKYQKIDKSYSENEAYFRIYNYLDAREMFKQI